MKTHVSGATPLTSVLERHVQGSSPYNHRAYAPSGLLSLTAEYTEVTGVMAPPVIWRDKNNAPSPPYVQQSLNPDIPSARRSPAEWPSCMAEQT
ncbi:hypothetical protein GCM10018966_005180 [Streptomyces yanii]